jgi:hypothetical protein
MTLNAGQQRMAREMLESHLEEQVRLLCKTLGLLYYHTRRSKGSVAGYPDDCIVNKITGETIYVENKREREQPSAAQQEWIDALAKQHAVYVWRPTQLFDGTIARVLKDLSARR